MRADVYLAENGYAPSRQKAKMLIEAGAVLLDGKPLTKASFAVEENTRHSVTITETERYVGRGGYKLEAALDVFGVNPAGRNCLDIGASTGGFTDCLLQNGAGHVTAIDAGSGQLASSLLSDSRVTNVEHYNARDLSREDFAKAPFDLVVADVSFISQTYILPRIPAILNDGGIYIGLVKPQFEAGKSAIGKGGIVKEKKHRLAAAMRVYDCGISLGLVPTGFVRSPIPGGDGNTEYLICFRKNDSGPALLPDRIAAIINQKDVGKNETNCADYKF